MPNFIVTGPDGTKYPITGPPGSTQQDAIAEVQRQLAGRRQADQPSLATQEIEGAGRGIARGLAGDVLGVGQVAQDVLPTSLTQPIATSRAAQRFSQFAQAPSANWGESVGRFVGGAAPYVAGGLLTGGTGFLPAVAGGAASGFLQPTRSGSLASHAVGGGVGALLGAGLGSIGSGAARQAMEQAGVRLTPYRMIPSVGRGIEQMLAGLPVLNRIIAHGRQVSAEDFNRALYDYVLDPIAGATKPTKVGSAGLDQLFDEVSGRLNQSLQGSTLTKAAIDPEIAMLRQRAELDLNDSALRRFNAHVETDVTKRLAQFNNTIGGDQLAGKTGIVADLGAESRRLWSSQDPQDRALGDYLGRLRDAVLRVAKIPDRAAYDSARQAYARMTTIMRPASNPRAGGLVDPDGLLRQLAREGRNATTFARGRMRLQPFAEAASRAGVPSISELNPGVSRLETLEALGLGGLAHYLEPRALPWALTSALPMLGYNRAGMSALRELARRAAAGGAGAGAAAGQAAADLSTDDDDGE